MIKIGDLELYASFVKDLHGHLIRINGHGLDDKKKMIVTFIPKDEMLILFGGLCYIASDETDDSLVSPINDQLNTEISVTKYPSSIIGKDFSFRVLIKSGQSVIRSRLTTDQLETLIGNMKVLIHRDIENVNL